MSGLGLYNEMKLFKKIVLVVVLVIMLVVLVSSGFLMFFNLPVSLPDTPYELGVTFSNRYAQNLGLDWKETYTAILEDLNVKKLRIPIYWDLVGKEKNQYDFSDIDWQLDKAQENGAEVILVIGQRVPRWPECFIPDWISGDEIRSAELLEFLEISVLRYKDNPAVKVWQVENEPFLPFFGECPEFDAGLLDEEIDLVKRLDGTKPILLTDSGELSFWYQAAKRADIFGTTMYRTVYKDPIGYYQYPVGPNFFKVKKWFVRKFASQNKVIVVELQAEPWASGWITDVPLAEQFQTMDEEKLVESVEFARKGRFPEIYLWGAEWWYWLKVKKDYPGVWEKARELFTNSVTLYR